LLFSPGRIWVAQKRAIRCDRQTFVSIHLVDKNFVSLYFCDTASIMAVDRVIIQQSLQGLPLATLIALATGIVLVAALAVRVLTNKFHGKTPPIEEGIPFIGGVVKFSKVRTTSTPPPMQQASRHCLQRDAIEAPTPHPTLPFITQTLAGTIRAHARHVFQAR
jgi:hypothetical protein